MFASLENAVHPLFFWPLDDQHQAREDAGLRKDFVIHSLRHNCGIRLGEGGRCIHNHAAGGARGTVTVSQWHVPPSPEAMERAIERLGALNTAATKRLEEDEDCRLVATVSATIKQSEPELAEQVP